MAKEFIVAIEIGSSKITGIAGKKNQDGSMTVMAIAKEDASACIRKGIVYNIDKTLQCITNIVSKLKNSLKTEIAYIYVGVGGQSIRSVKNTLIKELPTDTIINQSMVDQLMDANRSTPYPDLDILDAITQEYKVDKQFQMDPVGVPCSHLEGHFLNILCRHTYYKSLKKCVENTGTPIADMYIAPLALAESVLTENERRSGCILVDLGSQTTTVSVYHKNILRHLAVIPLGSANITRDITSLQMEEQDAEKLKLKYADANPEEQDEELKYQANADHEVESNKFNHIVEARLNEIIANVKFQIPDELDGLLLAGIVLTGGGSNMKNIDAAFRQQMGIEKVRIANFVNQVIHSNHTDITSHNGMMNTVLALLAKGNLNCAGHELTEDLFGDKPTQPVVPQPLPTNTPTTASAGDGTIKVVLNEKDKEEEKEENKNNEEGKNKEEEKEPKGPNLVKRIWHKTGDFLKKLTTEEE